MHERLDDADLALVATGILAELAGRVELQPTDELLEIGLIDATAQVSKVFENLPASEVRVQRQLAGQIAYQSLHVYRLLPDI